MSDINLKKVAGLGYTPSTGEAGLFFDSVKGVLCYMDEDGVQWFFGEQRTALASDLSAFTSATLADVTGIAYPVKSGENYKFEFGVVWRTAATTTGIKLGLTFPASPTVYGASVIIPGIGADGTGNVWAGSLSSAGDSVTASGGEATATDYEATVRGTIVPSADGTLQLQAATEVGGSGVTLRRGTSGRLWIP